MFRRHVYLHYRLVRDAITVAVLVGSALVASYLVLKAGL